MLKLDKKILYIGQGKEYLKQFYQLFSQILTIKKILRVFQIGRSICKINYDTKGPK